jgi:glutathione synthase/RimK-type ligase-like ATP-grasp enzyme
MHIAFLTCPGTHPGSSTRRADAFEHDVMVASIRPELEARGHSLVEIDWRSPVAAFSGMPLVLVGTPWDYQDSEAEFLAQLEALEEAGHTVCNSAATMRWNARKTYLRDLEASGAATIPTLWVEQPTAADIAAAMEQFACDTVVAKRQVGAGAEGQSIHHRATLDPGWAMALPAMLQPFLPQIQQDGEYSFLYIDGTFSHALRKRAAEGDYRVQSIYGGSEEAYVPIAEDLAAAQAVVDAVPMGTPLYARIDMVRGDDGTLLLMEAEMIEPYLYPEQGPNLGLLMAEAVTRRLEAVAPVTT